MTEHYCRECELEEFRRTGYLVVRQLLRPEQVAELETWARTGKATSNRFMGVSILWSSFRSEVRCPPRFSGHP